MTQSVSVIIPAFNEADYLPGTIDSPRASERQMNAAGVALAVEVIVVDNASTDGTAEYAAHCGAIVVHEAARNISRVRNAGAAIAAHDVLVFLDADTVVPAGFLPRVAGAMADSTCVGGAFDVVHRSSRWTLRAYLSLWRALGLMAGMAQGASQFCRKGVFRELGGYDETQYMGEDVDFYWRLKRLARRQDRAVVFVRDVRVTPSARRFDAWPLWRTFVWTNPLVILALRRRHKAWDGWYSAPPR